MAILYYIFFLQLSINAFSWDSCYYYYSELQDDKLHNYLLKTKDNLSRKDKIMHDYFLGRYYKSSGKTHEALRVFLNGIEAIERESQKDSMYYKYLDELAYMYNQGLFQDRIKGLHYANLSIQEKLKAKVRDDEMAKSYNVKGRLFRVSNANLDSALFYFKLSYDKFKIPKSKNVALHNWCYASLANNQLDGLEEKIKLNIRRSLAFYGNAHEESILLSSFFLKSERFEEAKSILDSLLEFNRPLLRNSAKKNIFINLQEIGRKTEDWKNYANWKDSLDVLNKITAKPPLMELVENVTLELELELEKEKAKTLKTQNWFIKLSALIASLLLVLGWLTRSTIFRQKHLRAVSELEKTKAQSELQSVRAEMLGEQRERQAIASTLHDHMASLLTAADLHLSVAAKGKNIEDSVVKAKSILKDVNQQVRSLSHQLVSPSLMKYGLVSAIETFLNGFQSDDLKISFESNLGEKRLDESKEVFIYRTCAELAQNVQKHSNADVLKVKLEIDINIITLQFLDNGKNDESFIELGFGLGNIQKRAKAHGGDLIIIMQSDYCFVRMYLQN